MRGFLVFPICVVVACSGDDPPLCVGDRSCSQPAPDGGPTAPTTSFAIELPPFVSVRGGQSITTEVKVARSGFTGPITIALGGTPETGISAAPLTIPADGTSGSLVITTTTEATQGNHELVVAGSDAEGGRKQSATTKLVVRGEPGTLDMSFGARGIARENAGTGAGLGGVKVQPDGRVVVAASFDKDLGALRFDENGAIDATFGSQGKTLTNMVSEGNALEDYVTSLALSNDGIYLAGWTQSPSSFYASARLDAKGQLDPRFFTTGYRVFPYQPNTAFNGSTTLFSVVTQKAGQPVFGGSVFVSGEGDHMVLVRMKADGTFDPTFSVDGFYDSGLAQSCQGVAIAENDDILCAAHTGGNSFGVARVTSEGMNREGFGATNSFATVTWGGPAYPKDVIALPGDKLLVAGDVSDGARPFVGFARLTSSGAFDDTLNGNGQVAIDLSAGQSSSYGGTVVDETGRPIVVATRGPLNGHDVVVVARLNENGELESAFAAKDPKLNLPGVAKARIALAPDGRIVVAAGLATEIVVARFWN